MVERVYSLKSHEVAGRIHEFYDKWKSMDADPAQKRSIAEAIVQKIMKARRERQSKGKEWYKELLEYLQII